jgi:membrane-associated protease RseP (regulator of RpoE activity)
MQKRRSNRWLQGLIAAPLALFVVGICMAGPQEEERRIEAIVIGEGADPDFLWVEAGSTAFLGVQVEEETEHEEGGALVTNVVEGSPAEEAGIEEGDIIIQFAGDTVRGPVSLTTKIHAREPGETVAIVVLRDGKKTKLQTELGDRKESTAKTLTMSFFGRVPEEIVIPEIDFEIDEKLKEDMERLQDRMVDLYHCEGDDEDCNFFIYSGFAGRPTLGVQLVETTPELREHLGGSEDSGVLVSKVLSGTPARDAGIMVGDLIVEIDGEEVVRSSDIRRQLAGKQGSSVEVIVVRDGARISIQIDLPEPDEDMPTGPRAALAPRALCAPAPNMAPGASRRVIKLRAPAAAPAPPVRRMMVAPPAPPKPAPPAPPAPPRKAQRLTYV